jgi:hypothetical protein
MIRLLFLNNLLAPRKDRSQDIDKFVGQYVDAEMNNHVLEIEYCYCDGCQSLKMTEGFFSGDELVSKETKSVDRDTEKEWHIRSDGALVQEISRDGMYAAQEIHRLVDGNIVRINIQRYWFKDFFGNYWFPKYVDMTLLQLPSHPDKAKVVSVVDEKTGCVTTSKKWF